MENSKFNTPFGVTSPVISVAPILFPASEERGEDLEVRISAPATGDKLPIILFAHGYGKSLDGYAPLVNYWAAHGFVVVQCTFLDSRRLGIPPEDPRTPLIWKYRVDDMKRMLNELDTIEAAIPGLKGRTDRNHIAAAGHSFGAQTTGMLLGARVIATDGTLGEDMRDDRIKAGVLLTPAGKGGADLSAFAAEHFPFMNPSYTEMTTPSLVVAGDKDISALTVRGWDWFTDAYHLSPGANALLTLFEAEHGLGGISGYEAAETTDENPERVAAVRYLTWAYLKTALYPEDTAWADAIKWLAESAAPLGKVEQK
ncbi:alpha/beta fold hydrolase [Flavobacterium sp. DG1-102-2]|uniref:alpha/beta hydrolase family protein n=1 Tax=Flavobacterium sp. DG1-102-2 TaxID=3081663 RepID=UPI00294909DE|nr:alpha/beta fold hydrolase [Flavobacterium sp. DG1-102-2]MDV6167527.1 alpha/beta fold hydrolase [Flavobacterium sp. DG1-102-2]